MTDELSEEHHKANLRLGCLGLASGDAAAAHPPTGMGADAPAPSVVVDRARAYADFVLGDDNAPSLVEPFEPAAAPISQREREIYERAFSLACLAQTDARRTVSLAREISNLVAREINDLVAREAR